MRNPADYMHKLAYIIYVFPIAVMHKNPPMRVSNIIRYRAKRLSLKVSFQISLESK